MHEFFAPLTNAKKSKDELFSSGVLDFWITLALKQADSLGYGNYQEREAAISKMFKRSQTEFADYFSVL